LGGVRLSRQEAWRYVAAATRAHHETATTMIEIIPDELILSWNTALLVAAEPS
jgi:hypothetical protein